MDFESIASASSAKRPGDVCGYATVRNCIAAAEGCPRDRLKPRIHRLAFQGKDGEGALVDVPQGLAADETLKRLDAQRELAQRQRPLGAQAAGAQALEVLGGGVLGAVDDAEVFAAAALHGRLHQPAGAADDKIERLDHHSL